MKERIDRLVGDNVGKHLWVGTFHAICARLLREFGEKIGLDRDFVVYDDARSDHADQRVPAAVEHR